MIYDWHLVQGFDNRRRNGNENLCSCLLGSDEDLAAFYRRTPERHDVADSQAGIAKDEDECAESLAVSFSIRPARIVHITRPQNLFHFALIERLFFGWFFVTRSGSGSG